VVPHFLENCHGPRSQLVEGEVDLIVPSERHQQLIESGVDCRMLAQLEQVYEHCAVFRALGEETEDGFVDPWFELLLVK
jgi:hypothetical protein